MELLWRYPAPGPLLTRLPVRNQDQPGQRHWGPTADGRKGGHGATGRL